MRALLLTLVAVVLAGGCARAEAPTTVSPDRLRDVVLQAEDVRGFRRSDAFPDYTAAHRAFRRLIGKVDAHDLLTGLPTTRVPAPPIGVEARAWTAHLEPMTVASVVWRSGNVLSWIALHGPDRNEAMQTVIELAKRQDARIEAARV
jgi:hypothetical protein